MHTRVYSASGTTRFPYLTELVLDKPTLVPVTCCRSSPHCVYRLPSTATIDPPANARRISRPRHPKLRPLEQYYLQHHRCVRGRERCSEQHACGGGRRTYQPHPYKDSGVLQLSAIVCLNAYAYIGFAAKQPGLYPTRSKVCEDMQ